MNLYARSNGLPHTLHDPAVTLRLLISGSPPVNVAMSLEVHVISALSLGAHGVRDSARSTAEEIGTAAGIGRAWRYCVEHEAALRSAAKEPAMTTWSYSGKRRSWGTSSRHADPDWIARATIRFPA